MPDRRRRSTAGEEFPPATDRRRRSSSASSGSPDDGDELKSRGGQESGKRARRGSIAGAECGVLVSAGEPAGYGATVKGRLLVATPAGEVTRIGPLVAPAGTVTMSSVGVAAVI